MRRTCFIMMIGIFTVFFTAMFGFAGGNRVMAFAPPAMSESSAPARTDDERKAIAEGHRQAADVVVARVNGEDIKLRELMEAMRTLTMQNYGKKKITDDLALRIKKESMDRLIIEKLVMQKAGASEVEVSEEEIDAQITMLKEGYNDGYARYLEMVEQTEESLRDKIRNFLLVKKYIDSQIADLVKIDDADLQTAYAVNKEQFTKKERVEIVDIIFFLNPLEAGSREKVAGVAQQIFQEHEGDPLALESDGTFVVQEASIVTEKDGGLYTRAKSMEPGALSEPVIIDGTYHIIKLTGYQPADVKPFDEVKNYLRQKLYEKFRQEKLETWKMSLWENAEIEIMETTVR